MTSDIAEAKRKLQLPALMHQIGLGEYAKKSARCPFHDDKSNSFSIFRTNGNGSWRWKCFACNEDGDEIDFLAKLENPSKGDAIRRYCELAGVNGSKLPVGSAFQKAKAVMQREPVPTKQEAFNWQFCVDALSPEDLERLSKRRGLSPEFCAWLGEEKLIGLHDGLFAFPVRDAQNNVVGAHVRADGDANRWFYHPKGTGTTPLVIGKLIPGEPVHVFESTWDGLAFLDVSGERSGVVIARGSSNAKQIAPLISQCSYCIVWTQNDEAGAKFEKDLVAATTCPIKRAKVPGPHKDLNDWTRAGATSEDLLNAVIKAESLRASTCELSDLLDSIVAVLRRYVVFPLEEQAEVIALWVAHTWGLAAFEYTPYLHVFSAETACGKSRLLEVLALLVNKPWKLESVSVAALFRKVELAQPTLLYDEIDNVFRGPGKDDETNYLRGCLNSGFKKDGKVTRCIGKDSSLEIRDFATFCPKALSGIGRVLSDTLSGRCLPIELQRQCREEKAERFREREAQSGIKPLRAELAAWSQATRVIDALSVARPELPERLSDRQQDICEPLVAIADMAGGDWPRRARTALVKLCTQTQPVVSTGVQLLAAIREIFDVAVAEKLTTRHALEELAARDEGPWAFMFEDALKHDKLNSAGAKLARMLSKYKTPDGEAIKPRPIRLPDGSVSKGYYKDDFKAAWERYLPSLSLSIPQKVVTEVTAVTHEGKSVTTGSFCNFTERLQEPEPLHFYLAL